MASERNHQPYQERFHRASRTPLVKHPLKALMTDTKRKHRYDYVETMLRNVPGNLGVSLRYRLLTPFYEEAGKNVVLWPGTRIKHPYKLSLGEGVQVGYNNFLQAAAGITIGDHTLLGPDVKIWTMNHKFTGLEERIIEQGYDCAPVIIEEDCWVAANAFIAPGAHLKKGCVVLPNSVVRGVTYDEYSVISGDPGRTMTHRGKFRSMDQLLGRQGE